MEGGGPQMASEKVQTLTDGNFDQSVIKASQLVLVDFWAEWCGPCKRLAPTVDELATDYDGRIVVGKLNVDDRSEEHTSELQSQSNLVCRLLLEKKKQKKNKNRTRTRLQQRPGKHS